MADERRSVLLQFDVDLAQAQKDLDATENKILDLKRAQTDLNKSYKEGSITQDQYVKENQKLNVSLQKESQNRQALTKLVHSENNSLEQQRAVLAKLILERNRMDRSTDENIRKFDALNDKIKELNTQIGAAEQKGGDFRRNVGNYGSALESAAMDAEVFGTSVGGVTSQVLAFANPATATIGLLGGLAAAYAQSSVGAKDLAVASAQLSTGLQIAANNFGTFVQSMTGLDSNEGGGFLTALAFLFNQRFLGTAAASQALMVAQATEMNKQLEISQAFAAGYAKDSERIAENFRRMRDDEEQTTEVRIAAADRITKELDRAGQLRISVLQTMLELIPKTTLDYENNRDAQLQVAQISSEIKDIEEEINGKLTENLTARRAILKAQAEEAAMRDYINKRTGRTGTTFGVSDNAADASRGELQSSNDLAASEASDRFNILTNLNRDMARENDAFRQRERDREKAQTEWEKENRKTNLQNLSDVTGMAMTLFDQQSAAYKIIASGDAIVNTYKGANLALGTYAPPYSFIMAALTVASGLANVARINGVGFASGGFTGSGFGSPDSSGFKRAGYVHENEYVVPKWQVSHPSYQPIISTLESGRLKGYADGGLVGSSITATIDQQLVMSNIIKSMPEPVVGVAEITKVQNRVRVKEKATKLGNHDTRKVRN